MNIDSLENWRRTHYSSEIGPAIAGEEVVVLGWIHDIRDLGGIRFLLLQDKEGFVQITIPRDKANREVREKVGSLQSQSSVGIKGVVKRMAKAPRGAEIVPSEIRILATAQQPLPLDITGRTRAGIERRLDDRVLDLRQELNQAIFRIQHVVLQAIRGLLSQCGFIEVFTPRIISTATEGGAALFPVAYFKREAFLAQSPQLYKEQLALDFEKVFEIGPFFRAEQSDTRRHLSEFISIDIETAFATQEDVMQVLEKLIQHIHKATMEKSGRDLKILKHKITLPTLPFPRFTYDEILHELQKEGIEVSWGADIPTPAFRELGKLHHGYYFITDWPTKSKTFYIKPKDDNPSVCEGFDLMWNWIEIASGGTRIHTKDLLVKRLKEQGLRPESFKFHLKAFDYGMPPHAGWAVGLGRLLMVLTGRNNIRDVVLFPRDRFRLTP